MNLRRIADPWPWGNGVAAAAFLAVGFLMPAAAQTVSPAPETPNIERAPTPESAPERGEPPLPDSAPEPAEPNGSQPGPQTPPNADGPNVAGEDDQESGVANKAAPATPLDAVMKDGIPKRADKRAKLRDDLYALLATSESEKDAKRIARAIERVWLTSGSDTVAVLMERALRAVKAKRSKLALTLLDTVVELAPDYAEGWNRRAYVHYKGNNLSNALGDLRRALALDPNHFKAMDGLGTILRETGEEEKAFKVYQRLRDIHPHWPGAEKIYQNLKRKVEGRGI